MKNLKSIIVLVMMAATITACRNAEKEQRYESVDAYTDYVDSISNVSLVDVSYRWDEIETTVRERRDEAENHLHSITDDDKWKDQYQQKIYATSEKYDDFRQRVITERQKTEATNAKQALRTSLFSNANIGDDMNFNWVNKDNILEVYEYFVTTVTNNKDSYSREEWDEIKMLYEALDSRKNTVEKEGLTSADNLKIAALKVQFAPMYKINRSEAKSEENKESKK